MVIVPVGYGFLMSQILETAQIDVDGIGSHTANALYQYRNRLQVIEEGTLNALAGSNAVPWFVAGDPTYARSIQVDYLNGQETPTIRRMEVAGPTGLCVGHLAGLGYHRRGLPWYCQEPRHHHHAVRQ